MSAVQLCWWCGRDVDVAEMIWLDREGQPFIWEKDSLTRKVVVRPVGPAAYHRDCGERFRVSRVKQVPVDTPPEQEKKGQIPLW